jgi:hypothetical protein
MSRKGLLAGIAVLVAAGAWWWWPTDRSRIVAASQELAETVSVPRSEPDLARVTRAARLSRFLTQDFRLVDARGRTVVDGRDAAIGFATKLRPPRGLQVSVGELDLEIASDGLAARARTVITLREPGEGGDTESVESRTVLLDWTKGEAWALSALTLEGEQDTK